MTEPDAPQPQPHALGYDSPRYHSNAPTLVHLAVIFNFISGGIDLFYMLLRIVALIFGTAIFGIVAARGSSPPGSVSPFVPAVFLIGVQALLTVFPLLTGAFKVVAAEYLRRKNRWGWGMMLAAGIVGCAQFPMLCFETGYCCFVWIPVGVGVFSIVAMSLQNVRLYLADRPELTGHFPVEPPSS